MILYGIDIVVVPSGTEITHLGETLTVTHRNMVQKGTTIYVTQPTYDRIKAEVKPAP